MTSDMPTLAYWHHMVELENIRVVRVMVNCQIVFQLIVQAPLICKYPLSFQVCESLHNYWGTVIITIVLLLSCA